VSEITVSIEVEVNPTEDPEKIKMAIESLFTPSSIGFTTQRRGGLVTARAEGKEGLMRFYTLLRQERILTAARRVLIRGLSGESVTFLLNKQVAYVRRISFCESVGESPLGPIRVEIKSDDPKALIDWLAPRMD